MSTLQKNIWFGYSWAACVKCMTALVTAPWGSLKGKQGHKTGAMIFRAMPA